jgi:hypothetical protein
MDDPMPAAPSPSFSPRFTDSRPDLAEAVPTGADQFELCGEKSRIVPSWF